MANHVKFAQQIAQRLIVNWMRNNVARRRYVIEQTTRSTV
jgi:hypothetical protein